MSSAAPGATAPRLPAPWLTLTLCALGLILSCIESLSQSLSFQRAAIEGGEVWRLLTGNLVHPYPGLAWVDLTLLLLLGTWIELRSRWLLLATAGASALLASCAVLCWTDYASYYGSSALSAGLLAAGTLRALLERRSRREVAVALVLVAYFSAKVVLESFAVWPPLLSSVPAEVHSLPLAHAAGALGGIVCALLFPIQPGTAARERGLPAAGDSGGSRAAGRDPQRSVLRLPDPRAAPAHAARQRSPAGARALGAALPRDPRRSALSCTGGPFESHPFFEGPDIHADLSCPGREETCAFLEGVLAEVLELFPSPHVHIGGDEVPVDRCHDLDILR